MLFISPDQRRAVITADAANSNDTALWAKVREGRPHTVITHGPDPAVDARGWTTKTRAEARDVVRRYRAQGFTAEYLPPAKKGA